MRNEQAGTPLDVLNREFPRTAPSMLSRSGRRLPPSDAAEPLSNMDTDNRRRALAQALRDEERNGQLPVDRAIRARRLAKRGMQSIGSRPDGGIGRVVQEHFDADDVASLRELQVAQAREQARRGVGPQAPFRPQPPNAVSPDRVFNIQQGDRIQNRRMLTPEQRAAERELMPFRQAEANINEELNMFEGGMQERGRRGDALRAQRGFSMDDLTGFTPNAAMPGREALAVLRRENHQPGVYVDMYMLICICFFKI